MKNITFLIYGFVRSMKMLSITSSNNHLIDSFPNHSSVLSITTNFTKEVVKTFYPNSIIKINKNYVKVKKSWDTSCHKNSETQHNAMKDLYQGLLIVKHSSRLVVMRIDIQYFIPFYMSKYLLFSNETFTSNVQNYGQINDRFILGDFDLIYNVSKQRSKYWNKYLCELGFRKVLNTFNVSTNTIPIFGKRIRIDGSTLDVDRAVMGEIPLRPWMKTHHFIHESMHAKPSFLTENIETVFDKYLCSLPVKHVKINHPFGLFSQVHVILDFVISNFLKGYRTTVDTYINRKAYSFIDKQSGNLSDILINPKCSRTDKYVSNVNNYFFYDLIYYIFKKYIKSYDVSDINTEASVHIRRTDKITSKYGGRIKILKLEEWTELLKRYKKIFISGDEPKFLSKIINILSNTTFYSFENIPKSKNLVQLSRNENAIQKIMKAQTYFSNSKVLVFNSGSNFGRFSLNIALKQNKIPEVIDLDGYLTDNDVKNGWYFCELKHGTGDTRKKLCNTFEKIKNYKKD